MRSVKLFRAGASANLIYEIGSLKETTNFNRILDTVELLTKVYKNTDSDYKLVDSLLKEGTFVALDSEDEYLYIIDTVKKTRKRKDGAVNHYNYLVTLAGVELLLQKTMLPNKSLRQLVVGAQKTVSEVLEDYFKFFFKPLWNINYEINVPEGVTLADEFTWKAPTLYDVINDIMPEKFKTSLKLDTNGIVPKVIVNFIDITEAPSESLSDAIISKVEYNKALEQNPKRVSTVIENTIIKDSITERLIPQTTDIGVMDDMDDSTRFETSFGIGNIKKAYVEGTLSANDVSILGHHFGHGAGYTKIDVTEFILTKEIYDSLLSLTNTVTFAGFANLGNLALDYKNFYMYYEKGKSYVGGFLENITKKIIITFTDFNLTYLLNYIGQNRPELLIEFNEIIVQQPEVAIPYFFNEDIKHFKLTIEYDVLDDIRFDVIKDEEGFGQFVQNQTSVYVNFDKFKEHLERVMAQLDGEEQVVFGRYQKNSLDKPVLNQLYNDKIVAQLVIIESLNYFDFMAVLTSKNNRIDSDAIINTQKRFYNIIDASDSIRRFDFIEANTNAQSFEDFQNINKEKVYGLLRTFNKDNGQVAAAWLKLSIYKTPDVIYFFGKALDNKYVGKRIVQETNYKATEGVFYTDKDTGEFYTSTLWIVETNNLPNNDYPLYTTEPTVTIGHYIFDFIKLKDSGEKLAFTVAMKIGGAAADYELGVYANYTLVDGDAESDNIAARFNIGVDGEFIRVIFKEINTKVLWDYNLIDEDAEADELIKTIISMATVDPRTIVYGEITAKTTPIATLVDDEATADELSKDVALFVDLEEGIGYTARLDVDILSEFDLVDELAEIDVLSETIAVSFDVDSLLIPYNDLIANIEGAYTLVDEAAEEDTLNKVVTNYIDLASSKYLTIKTDHTVIVSVIETLIDEGATAEVLDKVVATNIELDVEFDELVPKLLAPTIVSIDTDMCNWAFITIRNTNPYTVNVYDNGTFVSTLNALSNKVFSYQHTLNGVGGGTGGLFTRSYKFEYMGQEKSKNASKIVSEYCIMPQ